MPTDAWCGNGSEPHVRFLPRFSVTDSRQCPAKSKRTGEQCKRIIPIGAVVCKWHGGGAPQVARRAAKRSAELEVAAELTKLGLAIEVDPGEALLAMVYESAGAVAFYRLKVQGLADDELTGLVSAGQFGGEKHEPHVLVRMWDDERDRLANLSALALKAGIEERRVRMAEADATRLYDAVTHALQAAGLTPEQQGAFRRELAANLRSPDASR